MAVREYIGARYVPIFGRKGETSTEWDNAGAYEPLTVVTHQGNSYTSRQYVPVGVDISNNAYWALTGNYNAQVEAYRAEVQTFDNRITANADAILENSGDIAAEVADRISADDAITAAYQAADATIQAAVTELQNTVTPYTSTNTIANAIEKVSKMNVPNYLGVIGDSFSYGQYSDWITPTVNRMGFKGVVNKSRGSQGWVHGSTNFVTQFNQLINDSNFSKVSHIIIYGGVNDYRAETQNPDDLMDAFEAVKTAYFNLPEPRPQLFVCFGNGYSRPSEYMFGYHDFVCKCNRRLRNKGFEVIENVDQWLMCELTNCDYGDGIHPNNYGAICIAGYMCQVLQHSYNGVHKSQRITLDTNDGDPITGYVQYRLDDGVIGFEIRSTSLVTGFDATHPYIRAYTPNNLQMSIGKPGNISGIQHAVFSSEPIKMATDGSNLAYYVPILSLADNSIGVLLKGSGSNSQNYAVIGDYTNNGVIGSASAPIF